MEKTTPRVFAEERAKQDIVSHLSQLGVAHEVHDPLTQYILEATREAWMRGKEFGWKKAWNWKHSGQKQTPTS